MVMEMNGICVSLTNTFKHLKLHNMNSQEILQARLIDIVFDGRNKLYGAYVLRSGYDKRILTAMLASFAFVILMVFLIKSGSNEGLLQPIVPDIEVSPEIHIQPAHKPEPPRPQQPKTPRQSTVQYTNNIVIDPNAPVSTVASIHILENS